MQNILLILRIPVQVKLYLDVIVNHATDLTTLTAGVSCVQERHLEDDIVGRHILDIWRHKMTDW